MSEGTLALHPGNDFYQFVNYAWLTNPLNSIPLDYSSWGGFTKLYDDVILQIYKMV